jgi:hypothetical protein
MAGLRRLEDGVQGRTEILLSRGGRERRALEPAGGIQARAISAWIHMSVIRQKMG